MTELRINIFRSHDAYMCEGKSPTKIKLREKLEGYIKEFISVVPHVEKFCYPKFAEILKHSVQKTNFSASDAAAALLAVSTYASNLFTEPWRTEYREIRLYSGYYTHHIEKYLVGAEALLELMGYHKMNDKMVLKSPANSDDLTTTSLNALIAMCECQMLFNIYREVSKHLPGILYSDILSLRENYVCSEEMAIRYILASQYPPVNYCTDCVYPYSAYSSGCCRKCIPSYMPPVNGYRNYSTDVPYQSSFTNGHCNQVPTDKLIDLDEPSDSASYRRDDRRRYQSVDSIYNGDTRTDKPDRCRNSNEIDRSELTDVVDAFTQLDLSPDFENGKKKNGKCKNGRSRRNSKGKKNAKNTLHWECKQCTYRNSPTRNICEICHKSKNFNDDQPMICGGKECPKCTLVNKKNATKCAVCGADLSHCFHYV